MLIIKYINEVVISLNFPHWHSGTLPLTDSIGSIFPSAYESPRVRFTFIDGDTGQKISGWVIRSSKYAYGLREWYSSLGLIPGSLIHIIRSKNPGEVIVKAEKRRPTRGVDQNRLSRRRWRRGICNAQTAGVSKL